MKNAILVSIFIVFFFTAPLYCNTECNFVKLASEDVFDHGNESKILIYQKDKKKLNCQDSVGNTALHYSVKYKMNTFFLPTAGTGSKSEYRK